MKIVLQSQWVSQQNSVASFSYNTEVDGDLFLNIKNNKIKIYTDSI